MADRRDLDFTYSLTDRVVRLSLGELTDFSGAKYDGDFSLTLEQAQRRKHDYVAEQVGIKSGTRVLDLGCDWGGLLNYIRNAGATGLGVTLSSAQAASCRRHGLDVHVHDARLVPIEEISTDAPRDSDAWILGLLGCQFPGSWLPLGQEQVVRCAEPRFRLISSVSGRLDYIETINQWNARIGAPSFRKTLLKLRLVPRWLTSSDFRLAFTSGVSATKICFERGLLDHYRLVFEKAP